MVVASGNCGPVCPSSTCGGFVGVGTPGISPEAITVGAVNDYNIWACFSSGADIPGVGIKPDVVAPGVNINSSVPGAYATKTGTSMATPHVAGAAALLLQSNNNFTPEDVKYIIERTALRLGNPGKDIQYGSGLVDLRYFVPTTVSRLLKYRIDYPEFVYLDEDIDIFVNSTMEDIKSIDAYVYNPDSALFQLYFNNISSHVWKSVFNGTFILGTYMMNITITDILDQTYSYEEKFDVIRYNLTEGYIQSLNVPAQIAYGLNLPIQVVFENIGNRTLETLVEIQIMENDQIIDSFQSPYRNVSANSTTIFDFNWTAEANPGIKDIKAIAAFDGDSYTRTENFDLIDDTAPIVNSVEFKSGLFRNNPHAVDIYLEDTSSDITGNMTLVIPDMSVNRVPIRKISDINNNIYIVSIYENTTQLGNYSFSIKVCDNTGYCTDSGGYSFTVEECSEPQVLLISEEEKFNNSMRFKNALNNTCLSVWDTFKSLNPPMYYLDRFEAIIWSTGNYFESGISNQSAELLKEYIKENHSIFIEGPEIALNHIRDDFMINLTHSSFEADYLLENVSGISVYKSFPHPILKGLPNQMDYNTSYCPYPDAVSPVNGGVSLLDWNLNNSAIVVSNDGHSKVVYASFTVSSLTTNQDQFIRNIVGWLLTDNSNADLIVDTTDYDYLIDGFNGISITINNSGSIDADNVLLEIFIEGNLIDTSYIDVNAGNQMTTTRMIDLDSGSHTLGILLNGDFSIAENVYINNLREQEIYVATPEADLYIDEMTHIFSNDSSEIKAKINNIGGSDAFDATIELYLDGVLNDSKQMFIGYGSSANLTFEGPIDYGIYDIELRVNSLQTITESDYSNNNKSSRIYICSREKILIVGDDDPESFATEYPDSTDDFKKILDENHYCTLLWKESVKGHPTIDLLNEFDVVIWSSGNYFNMAIDPEDMTLIEQYAGSILFEGSDITFDHENDIFPEQRMHVLLANDLILNNTEELNLTT
ncbi:MAG: S8 family serine peptidase, partial [Nanoarchaeota archaeon]|nr:S8 family serine peptidase [Nanoarchaeota archaeon]